MLTGNLVRVRITKNRIHPWYLDRNDAYWLEVAESLLLVFREGVGMSRGEIQEEMEALIGAGRSTFVHQGLAKILEDRAEFEVVSDVPPEQLREQVFTAAAAYRRQLAGAGHRAPFRREFVLDQIAQELKIEPAQVSESLFADLRDENRMLRFDDLSAQRLLDRYNVGLAQAVLLRSVRIEAEVRREKPARYRQLFRHLKFHRLLYQVRGNMNDGYVFHIDGPLSLFSATNKYGLQMALFLPALLLCEDYRLDAELRWGPKREPKTFQLEAADGLVSHYADSGRYTPAELDAFVARFRQVAPAWEISEATDLIELGGEGVWVPDYRIVHKATGLDVFLEVLGFWKRSSLDRLLRLLPQHGPTRYVLAITEKLKVDEHALSDLSGPVMRFRDIPNATELATLLDSFLPRTQGLGLRP